MEAATQSWQPSVEKDGRLSSILWKSAAEAGQERLIDGRKDCTRCGRLVTHSTGPLQCDHRAEQIRKTSPTTNTHPSE